MFLRGWSGATMGEGHVDSAPILIEGRTARGAGWRAVRNLPLKPPSFLRCSTASTCSPAGNTVLSPPTRHLLGSPVQPPAAQYPRQLRLGLDSDENQPADSHSPRLHAIGSSSAPSIPLPCFRLGDGWWWCGGSTFEPPGYEIICSPPSPHHHFEARGPHGVRGGRRTPANPRLLMVWRQGWGAGFPNLFGRSGGRFGGKGAVRTLGIAWVFF